MGPGATWHDKVKLPGSRLCFHHYRSAVTTSRWSTLLQAKNERWHPWVRNDKLRRMPALLLRGHAPPPRPPPKKTLLTLPALQNCLLTDHLELNTCRNTTHKSHRNALDLQGPGNSLLFVGQLVDKSLVQAVEHKYRLHDLVLAFVKSKLRCLKMERVVLVTSRLAQYLSRLSVLREYAEADEMQGGLYALLGLWGSVEELSRDNTLQTTMYGKILSELEACEATADTASSYRAVGKLFFLQVGLFSCFSRSCCLGVFVLRDSGVYMFDVNDGLYCKDRGMSFLTHDLGALMSTFFFRSPPHQAFLHDGCGRNTIAQ